MATRSTNVESDESTMSQNAVSSCNRRLLAPAIARTRLNIHLRSEDFVRIVLRGAVRLLCQPASLPVLINGVAGGQGVPVPLDYQCPALGGARAGGRGPPRPHDRPR